MSRKKKKDPVAAVPRYLSGTRAVRRGLELQRERILAARTDAPLLLEGTPAEVVNFTLPTTSGTTSMNWAGYET